MGAVCSGGHPEVDVWYQGREFELPECPRAALKSTRLFTDYVHSELLLRGVLDSSATIRLYMRSTGLEIHDEDLRELKALRRRGGLSVLAERSAASDAARDNYKLEEQVTESFLHMLLEEAARIGEEGFTGGQEIPCPEFGGQSFGELAATLKRAGALAEADSVVHEVRGAMTENLHLLNRAAVLAQHVFEVFPTAARGLSSKDRAYVAEAANTIGQHVEGIAAVAAEAMEGVETLRSSLHARQRGYKVGADARGCASSVGIGACTAVPVADALATHQALAEGANAAAQSPFTSWLTSQHVHMHYWNTPGGLFTGSKVHATATVVFHFHVLSFVTSGGAALLAIGGLGALLRYRCRRLGSWRLASEMVVPALESLKAHEDYWRGLRFPCDQIARTLPQALKEQDPTSFNAIVAWRKILKDTAVLITAINAYFVWLDLAGWVPSNFPLRSRLQQITSSDPYDMMAQMIQQRPPRRPNAGVARGQLAPRAAGWKEAGSETSSWERSTEGGGVAPSLDRQGAEGEEEPASGTPSERARSWCDDDERCTEESWHDDSEEVEEEGEEQEEEDEGEGAEAGNPFDEELASAEEPSCAEGPPSGRGGGGAPASRQPPSLPSHLR